MKVHHNIYEPINQSTKIRWHKCTTWSAAKRQHRQLRPKLEPKLVVGGLAHPESSENSFETFFFLCKKGRARKMDLKNLRIYLWNFALPRMGDKANSFGFFISVCLFPMISPSSRIIFLFKIYFSGKKVIWVLKFNTGHQGKKKRNQKKCKNFCQNSISAKNFAA